MTNNSFLQLDYPFVSLSYPNYRTVSLADLEKMMDHETSKMLKNKDLISGAFGSEILKSELVKRFFIPDNSKIYIRNNIYDLLSIFSHKYKPEEIKLPAFIQNIQEIYPYISHLSKKFSNKNFYMIDYWGLDYKELQHSNFIFFSSINILYGIEKINLCWAVINSKEISSFLDQYLMQAGQSICPMTEIYSIAALRGSSYIFSKKNIIYTENRKKLEMIAESNGLKINLSELFPKAIIPIEKSSNFIEFARKNYGIILEKEEHDNIAVYFGTKEFRREISFLSEAIKAYYS